MGCLGERLGDSLQETYPEIDLALGPDSYRKLPFLLNNLPSNRYVPADNPLEDYDDIVPVRKEGASAWVAISRGCDNNCTYCIVPYMRGKERSRKADSIINEVKELVSNGFVEVTLLGQNVNSYQHNGIDFSELIQLAGGVHGIKRVRFATSHPKDLSEKLIYAIRDNENICPHVHLPVQSGSDRILAVMGREYTSLHYLSIINILKQEIKDVCITTDIISGYPDESIEDHNRTLKLVREVEFDGAFTFKYSPREGTPAFNLMDNVPEIEKTRRLSEISNAQRTITAKKNRSIIGKSVEVMIETRSKRSSLDALGKTPGGKNVVVENCDFTPGTFCNVKISGTTSQTLLGEVIEQ
jgi:tRNA-2-methylthio-N6-dimethylallyladenosine synthase